MNRLQQVANSVHRINGVADRNKEQEINEKEVFILAQIKSEDKFLYSRRKGWVRSGNFEDSQFAGIPFEYTICTPSRVFM